MRKKILYASLVFASISIFNFSCQKESMETTANETGVTSKKNNNEHGHLKQTKTFSSDVAVSWLNIQLTMFKTPRPAGTGSQATDRAQAYSGIALYEAVMPGMPGYQTLTGQLTDFPTMPSTEPGKAYHWAASANAALAEISRLLFNTTAQVNKDAMNNLENTLQTSYADEADAATIERSIAFGKEVATRVFAWSVTDGFANINPPYIPPVGVGLWVPTAPPPAAAINAYAFQRRLIVPGSAQGTALEPLPSFSTDPGSAFYAMVKELYDASLLLTHEQKAMADYFKDAPGYGAGGGYVWVLMEALRIAQPSLDQAAIIYAKTGMAQHDVTIVLFTSKYNFNTMRPVTYINAYIDPAWNPYLGTPNHPEFPAGHATTNGAVLTILSNSFGENFPMTLRMYDYLGYPSRPYSTFKQMGLDMADSRFYGGIHYKETCTKSIAQGKKVAINILSTVKFKK